MYKLLLSWRYLRTRFIALASIVSVTLGVATLIVVNSVMAGFVDQMKNRLHGVLSDVEISAPLLSEIRSPDFYTEHVRRALGDDLENITCVVRTPALLSFHYWDLPQTQQVMLIGIDDETFGKVTDFRPYLTNSLKRERFSFELENEGYENIDDAGWDYRRRKVANSRAIEEARQRYQDWNEEQNRLYEVAAVSYQDDSNKKESADGVAENDTGKVTTADGWEAPTTDDTQGSGIQFADLPEVAPNIEEIYSSKNTSDSKNLEQLTPGSDGLYRLDPVDPSAQYREAIADEDLFDPMRDQHIGIILGKKICTRKMHGSDGEVKDGYMIRPGDDVTIMLATVGDNARPTSDNCTVVDFYDSNMHEYDSTFAFMPISELQKMRGMIDPVTQEGSVSTIQIKLKETANLNEVRNKLIALLPPEQTGYDIRTWEDTQRPLLSAVKMELTILNILLFLIIAVAGFGILATFYMIVVEKTKDIGILKALGAPSRGIMSIFLGYGLSLGSVGTGVGIILGLVFVCYINEIADLVAIVTGQEVFDPTIYFFSEIPTIVSPWMVVWVAIGAIMIAVMASVLPALRAARLHPVEALRYE